MTGPAPDTPRRPDGAALVIAALLAVLAALIFWKTRAMPVAANYARVGPTTFPYVVAACLAVLAVATAVSALRGGFPEREADHAGPMLWIVAGLVAQMLLLKPDLVLWMFSGVAEQILVKFTGFSVATGALFALVARGFGRGPLWLTFPIGVVFAFVVWLIFARVLQLSLPAGPLERLVP